jgi:hypothetical protein
MPHQRPTQQRIVARAHGSAPSPARESTRSNHEAGLAAVPDPSLVPWSLQLKPEVEEVYWRQQGDARQIRSDYALSVVLIILHSVILVRPLHAIFFATRVSRLVVFSFQLYAILFRPRGYARNRTPIVLALRVVAVFTLWLMQFYVSSSLEVYRMSRAELHLEGSTVKPFRQLLVASCILPLMVQGVGWQLRLPIQLTVQALSTLVNIQGSLSVLISHIDEFSQGPGSDFVGAAQQQVRCMVFPGSSLHIHPLLLRVPHQQQQDLSENEVQQRLEAKLMAVVQLYVFLNAFLGYVVPMYVGYINELRDKLHWLQQRQEQAPAEASSSDNSRRAAATGRFKRSAAVLSTAELQLMLLAHNGHWIRAVLLHYVLLHGCAVLCWGLGHLAARPVLLMFGCSLA